ncbi:hypothetical protein [Streptococcus halotolerans]|uniref:hypothetical protein n=1 Tax=Streptococcus halotolerans TaxID=1814128 RepID=UPI0007877378|nr:hypothetical protein [Streptococcus halotolerans]
MATSYQENSTIPLDDIDSFDKKTSTKIGGLAHFYVILLSAMVSTVSILLPVIKDFSTVEQTQNLYTGLMMSKGVLPYNDIYATGGFLYYAVIALSYFLGANLWLIAIHFLAYYISGRYLYKIIIDVTQSNELAVAMNLLFYLFNLILGFGGLHPIQWAFPFLLSMIWFLISYFKNRVKDECFIIFGVVSTVGLFIEPRLLVFWLISNITILIFNLKSKRFARGFYQALCFIFGSILIGYIVGYFIFNEQLLAEYIAQPILFNLTVFQSGHENVIITAIFQLILVLSSGLYLGFMRDNRNDFTPVKIILISSIMVYSIYALLSQTFNSYYLLFVIVQGIILSSRRLVKDYQSSLSSRTHRRNRRGSLAKQFFYSYFTKAYLLPLILLVGVVGQLGYHYYLESQNINERQELTSFISKNTDKTSKIYIWDNQATVYLQSERQSTSKFSIPDLYTVTSKNKQSLEDSLLQDNAEFFIVKKGMTINKSIANNISRHYKRIKINGVNSFIIYKLK